MYSRSRSRHVLKNWPLLEPCRIRNTFLMNVQDREICIHVLDTEKMKKTRIAKVCKVKDLGKFGRICLNSQVNEFIALNVGFF